MPPARCAALCDAAAFTPLFSLPIIFFFFQRTPYFMSAVTRWSRARLQSAQILMPRYAADCCRHATMLIFTMLYFHYFLCRHPR